MGVLINYSLAYNISFRICLCTYLAFIAYACNGIVDIITYTSGHTITGSFDQDIMSEQCLLESGLSD